MELSLLDRDKDLTAVRRLPGYPAVLRQLEDERREEIREGRRGLQVRPPAPVDDEGGDPDEEAGAPG